MASLYERVLADAQALRVKRRLEGVRLHSERAARFLREAVETHWEHHGRGVVEVEEPRKPR